MQARVGGGQRHPSISDYFRRGRGLRTYFRDLVSKTLRYCSLAVFPVAHSTTGNTASLRGRGRVCVTADGNGLQSILGKVQSCLVIDAVVWQLYCRVVQPARASSAQKGP